MTNSTTVDTLTDLAEVINSVRIATNIIEATAPQSGVYGDISNALKKTLALLVDGEKDRADRLYELILDGNTVAEALAIEAPEHAALESEPETAAGRIRKALDTLARHGITEAQVQAKSELNDELWDHVTNAETTRLSGLRLVGMITLANALVLDAIYLLNGDRTHAVTYSPCTLSAIISDRYPAAG